VDNALGRPVTIAERSNPPLEVILPDKVAAIQVHVIDADGGAVVTAQRFDGGGLPLPPATQPVSGPGDLTIDHLVAGEYLVAAFVAENESGGIKPGLPANCGYASRVIVEPGQAATVKLRPCLQSQ